MRRLGLLILGAACLASCASQLGSREPSATEHPQIIDGHVDFVVHFLIRDWSVDALDIERSLPGQADAARWREGGVNEALTTVGSDKEAGSEEHFPRVLVALDWLDALVERHSRALMLAGSAEDFDEAAEQGRIALMPALEGGDQLDGSLSNLREAHRRGLRSMVIVYDHHNEIGNGAMAMPASATIATNPHGGLSSFGRELIAEMNRLGVVIDLSHAAEPTAIQTIQLSKAPAIFSHSGARTLADTPRDLSDRVLREVRANNGIVMVPLAPYLTTTAHWQWWLEGEQRFAELASKYDQVGVSGAMARWDAQIPEPAVTISNVADQVDYIARVAGKNHVGIGTDFDGMGMGSFGVPHLNEAAALPALLDELKRRGWSSSELYNLTRGNLLRVLRQVQGIASHS